MTAYGLTLTYRNGAPVDRAAPLGPLSREGISEFALGWRKTGAMVDLVPGRISIVLAEASYVYQVDHWEALQDDN